jgi:DNA-binding MarR family transcriptional regulator
MKYNKGMKKDDLQDNLNWLFMAASLRAKRSFLKLAEELDLTAPQVFALCFLEPDKPMPMKAMANLLNCEPSNVTAIIDRLFALDYIARREDPDDRRIKMISLTDRGRKFRELVVERVVSYPSERLERLTSQEKDQFKAMLLKILA